MRWHYNLGGNSDGPFVRDAPVSDAGDIAEGEALTMGATTVGATLITSGALGADFVGVSNETITASTTDLTDGTIVYAKVVMEPTAVYKADYDLAAANDIDVVSSTSTATTLGTSDNDLDGSWLYTNTGTGLGQLAFIGEATTTVMTLDTSAPWVTTPDATTDVILIRKPWQHADGGGKDLNAAGILLLTDEDETGAYLVFNNYIESTTIASHPLDPAADHMRQDISSNDVIFSSDIYPLDHLLRGASTMA